MRLVTYRNGDDVRIGVVRDDEVVSLSSLAATMLDLIDGGTAMLEQARELATHAPADAALSQVTLLAPIPRPRKNIICLGMNYAAHAIESLRAKGLPEKLPTAPVFFTKAPTAVTGPETTVPLFPDISSERDWEVELAVVIGRSANQVAPEEAQNYIFGYTILNDVSARDLQSRHQQFFYSKSLNGSAPLGPWIVTTDELSDPHNLGIRLRLNGEIMQDSHTGDMIFDIPTSIATLTRGLTLEPGDILATGTPSGVGMGMNPQRWLQPGDVMEAEIDRIGVLRNPVG
jgi:2-keto-4-pentenoate hydratase/2-oxohepta-3-ene-1,7-dioic acid hydratase in catechol pathway